MEYRLRPATAEDEPFLKELFYDVRAAEFLPLQLPEAALGQLLEMQYRGQKSGYEQQFPNAESSIVWVGPYRVGRLLVSTGAAAIQLVDIALLAAFRGQGIGRKMLEALCQLAAEAGLPLRLSVREENRAMKLYTRLGFVRRGEKGPNIEMEWGGVARPDTAGEETIPESGPVAPGPTGAYFRSIRGTRAFLERNSAERVVLTLASVRALRPSGRAMVSVGDSFALTFEGDSNGTLVQGVYNLEFEDGYRTEMFLVPIAADKGVTTYESIFNRMKLKAAAE